MSNMKDDTKGVLISSEEIAAIVKRLGKEISDDYADRCPVMVSILKGAFIFMADLVREVTVPCSIDFMCVSSYGNGAETSGRVKIIKDLDTNIEGKDVIIVEDILDSGVTLSHLIKMLSQRNPKSIKICTLFDKPERHKVDIKPAYKGVDVPNEFIVGYGLDYAERYRNLPDVCILKPEIYA